MGNKFTLIGPNGRSLDLMIGEHWLTKQGFKCASNLKAVYVSDSVTGEHLVACSLDKKLREILDHVERVLD